MSQKKRGWQFLIAFIILAVYAFIQSEPITEETLLKKDWIRSFDSVRTEESQNELIPFQLNYESRTRFGYFDESGVFALNRVTEDNLSLASGRFAEYGAQPAVIDVKNARGESLQKIENPRGYPLFLDGIIYVINYEQNTASMWGENGVLWRYTFTAPLTCITGGKGFLLSGALNGVIEMLDGAGSAVFSFQTGGSRIPCVYGIAASTNLSNDAAHFAAISGLDEQRFLLFEKSGASYKIAHHEFLKGGNRRPVHINFIDAGSKVVYEADGNLGLYDIKAKSSYHIPLNGRIAALDASGENGIFFVITQDVDDRMTLICIQNPDIILLKTSFKSEAAFLSRKNGRVFVGSDSRMASLSLIEE